MSRTAGWGIEDSDGWSKFEDNFCPACLTEYIQLEQSLYPTIALNRNFTFVNVATPHVLCIFHLYLAAVVQVIASSRASQGSWE